MNAFKLYKALPNKIHLTQASDFRSASAATGSKAVPFLVAGVRCSSVNAPTLLRLSFTEVDLFRSALQQK